MNKSMKYADPDKFSGANKEDYDRFAFELNNKVKSNADHYLDEAAKVSYAITRLEGTALDLVRPRMLHAGQEFHTVESLMTFLATTFGDPDKKNTASTALLQIRQRNRCFHDYLAEFNRYAGNSGFNDDALRIMLKAGLSEELKDIMVYKEDPDTLVDLTSMLLEADNRLRARKAENKPATIRHYAVPASGYRSTAFTIPPPFTPAMPTVSTKSRTYAAPSIAPSDSASNYLGPVPMDLSAVSRPVPYEEKQRRRALGLCGHCGGTGHQATTCPTFVCFNCKQQGHGSKSCPQPRKLRAQAIKISTPTSSNDNAIQESAAPQDSENS